MMLPAAVVMGLAAQCAPNVAPATIAAIVQTESRGNELAIGVNGLGSKVAQPTSVAQAIEVARFYVAKGYSVDLGLGQINSRNMKALGLTWDTVFEPCTNIAAAGAVISGNYHSVRAGLHPQRALRIALSMYKGSLHESALCVRQARTNSERHGSVVRRQADFGMVESCL